MYQLPTDFDTIRNTSPNEWKNKVTMAIERASKERLLQECHKSQDGTLIPKTKTASIKVKNPAYKREPETEILQMTKQETRTLMIARYGMLECGKNFGGTIGGICPVCNTHDDESHRLNHCKKWKEINFLDASNVVDFDLIYSNDVDVLRDICKKIQTVWNTRNAHGVMNT